MRVVNILWNQLKHFFLSLLLFSEQRQSFCIKTKYIKSITTLLYLMWHNCTSHWGVLCLLEVICQAARRKDEGESEKKWISYFAYTMEPSSRLHTYYWCKWGECFGFSWDGMAMAGYSRVWHRIIRMSIQLATSFVRLHQETDEPARV